MWLLRGHGLSLVWRWVSSIFSFTLSVLSRLSLQHDSVLLVLSLCEIVIWMSSIVVADGNTEIAHEPKRTSLEALFRRDAVLQEEFVTLRMRAERDRREDN